MLHPWCLFYVTQPGAKHWQSADLCQPHRAEAESALFFLGGRPMSLPMSLPMVRNSVKYMRNGNVVKKNDHFFFTFPPYPCSY